MSLAVTNTRQLKHTNVLAVKQALKEGSSVTKAMLSRRTGLSLATCGTILNELLASGEVLCSDQDRSSGGRPAAQYMFNADFSQVLCVHVFPLANELTSSEAAQQYVLSYTVANLLGQYKRSGRFEFADMRYDRLEATILQILFDNPGVASIGVGLPSVILDGVVLAGSMPSLNGEPLVQKLSDRLGVYVQIGNDVNYATYGFYKSSRLKEEESVAYLYYPWFDKPGCGLVINGQVYEGSTQFAGEISYLTDVNAPVAEEITRLAVMLTTILNPDSIALTGPRLTPADMDAVHRAYAEQMPEKHRARLVYRSDITDDYIRGLVDMTLEGLEERAMLE